MFGKMRVNVLNTHVLPCLLCWSCDWRCFRSLRIVFPAGNAEAPAQCSLYLLCMIWKAVLVAVLIDAQIFGLMFVAVVLAETMLKIF